MEIGSGFIVYLILVNLISFILMGIDKKLAARNMHRIPEKVFFSLGLAGGGLGVFFGMKRFRHKTKHPKFYIGIPLIVFVEAAVFSYFFLTK